MFSGEAENTNLIVFGLIKLDLNQQSTALKGSTLSNTSSMVVLLLYLLYFICIILSFSLFLKELQHN